MKELREFLETRGFTFMDNVDDSTYYFYKELEGIPFYYALTEPHEGNKNRYMFRANPVETFDKWGNCEFQRFFKTKEDFVKNYGLYLVFSEEESN